MADRWPKVLLENGGAITSKSLIQFAEFYAACIDAANQAESTYPGISLKLGNINCNGVAQPTVEFRRMGRKLFVFQVAEAGLESSLWSLSATFPSGDIHGGYMFSKLPEKMNKEIAGIFTHALNVFNSSLLMSQPIE